MNSVQAAAYSEGFEAGKVFAKSMAEDEAKSLRSQLEEAKEIIRESLQVLDMLATEMFPNLAELCDGMGVKEHGDRIRAAIVPSDDDLLARARSFLKENGNA